MNDKMKIAYAVVQRGTHVDYRRIGVAFLNTDGSINVKLDAIPLSGEIHIRDYPQKEDPRG